MKIQNVTWYPLTVVLLQPMYDP